MSKTFKRPDRLGVYLDGTRVGQLGQPSRGPLVFAYDPEWIANGYPLSPMNMEWNTNPQAAADRTFRGLHGVFNDSLPDGWGLLLMDRFFRSEFGIARDEITHLDRLAYLGRRAMGALEFQPEYETEPENEVIDLAGLYANSQALLSGNTEEVVKQLRMAGGSPQGARPKITLGLSEDSSLAITDFAPLPEGYEHWILKFRNQEEHRDTGAIEYAYAEIARRAGLTVSETALIHMQEGKNTERFFCTRRFDRSGMTKVHMMTVSGIAYASHREPCLDYEDLLAATLSITNSAAEVERMAVQMVFNAMTLNRDDHAKNFAFLRQGGGWALSPSYDLTYAPQGLGGQHTTAYSGSVNPRLRDIKNVCKGFPNLNPYDLIDGVYQAVAEWPVLTKNLDISKTESNRIYKAMEAMAKQLNS